MNQDAYVLETYSEPSQTSKMEHLSNTRFFYKQHFYNHIYIFFFVIILFLSLKRANGTFFDESGRELR